MPIITRYGYEWDTARTTDLAIELKCYSDNVLMFKNVRSKNEVNTGHPAEYHLRNAWQILWPDYIWNEWAELQAWAWCNYLEITNIGHAGSGKCLGRGTKVMLYDGSIINAEDVEVGMLLMGDDSTPRRVLSLARGRQKMYRITGKDGTSWTCNSEHILSLKAARVPRKSAKKGGKQYGGFALGDVRDIPIKDVLPKHDKRFWSSIWKQFRVPVEFSNNQPLEFSPRIYGMWIADGGFATPSFCKPHGPLTVLWKTYFEGLGYAVTTLDHNRCPHLFARKHERTNPFTSFIKESTETGEKRILRRYLTASRKDRIELLCGLLDGDGYASGNSIEITTKYNGLADDIVFLARSLGLYAHRSTKIGKIASIGFEGEYQRIYLSGNWAGFEFLRLKVNGDQYNDPLLQTFSIEDIGEDDYFGFTVDGNHRFLLGDFTVTHNSFGWARVALLDYIANPTITSTTMATPKFEQLKTHIGGDLMAAKDHSPLRSALEQLCKFTSTSNEFSVKLVGGGNKYVLHGTAADQSDTDASKLRGQHAPRRRLFADECEHMGDVLYNAEANGMLDPDFRCVMSTNPSDRSGAYCRDHAAPVDGWGSISTNDKFWRTKLGICVHFNALLSPNVKAKKVVVKGMVTEDYVNSVRTSYGENSLQWWMYVLGFPPPDGVVNKIWPSATLERARQDEIFDFAPTPVASLDPAFGGDDCIMLRGNLGKMRDGRQCVTAVEGYTIKLNIGDSRMLAEEQIAEQVEAKCKEWGVTPENFIMDCTGQGRGVYEILRAKWGAQCQAINYNDKATERPIRDGGRPACDEVQYFIAELWFRASYLAKEGLLKGLSNITSRATDDLGARMYSIKNVGGSDKMLAEPKDDFKSRIGHSCDAADAFCQFGELMLRKGVLNGYKKDAAVTNWGAAKKIALKFQQIQKETWQD